MKLKLPHRIVGPFAAEDLGAGAWRLTRGVAGGNELYVQGAAANAGALLRDRQFDAVIIEWRADGVTLTLDTARKESSFAARHVICHEPDGGVFGALPLAAFDQDAQRFWRRVFMLMRIPGGRHLLGLMSRRSRTAQ